MHTRLLNHRQSSESFFVIIIMAVAVFFRFYRLDALAAVPHALIGVFTVYAVYILARELFNWKIAGIAGFLLAISAWHTAFSRSVSPDIWGPFLFVTGIYFLWLGLKHLNYFYFVLAGLALGAEFYISPGLRLMPIAIVLTAAAYWWSLEKDFYHEKREYVKNQLIHRLIVCVLIIIVVGTLSLSSKNTLNSETTKALSGRALIYWPIAVIFAIGFIKSLVKMVKMLKSHGHFSSVHVLLLAWLFVGGAPILLFKASPASYIILAPVISILAAEGLWWLFEKLDGWYGVLDLHEFSFVNKRVSEHAIVSAIVIFIFLGALSFAEYARYFKDW